MRNQALLEVLYGTGIRVSECANLTVDAVDFQASVLLVHGKGNKDRYVPFGSFCTRRLKGLLREWPRAINDKISKNIRMSLLIIMVNKSRQQGLNMS